MSWLLRILALPFAEQLMPVLFPRCVADRGSDVSRLLRRGGIEAPTLGQMWRASSSLAGADNRKAFVRTMRTVTEPEASRSVHSIGSSWRRTSRR